MSVCPRSEVSCIRARHVEEDGLESLSPSHLEIASLAQMLGEDWWLVLYRIVVMQGWGVRSLNEGGQRGRLQLAPRPCSSAEVPSLAQDTMILLISDHN